MNQVEQGLYAKLSGDTTLMALVTDVAPDPVPQGGVLPYVVFGAQTSADRYTLAKRAWEELRYQVKGITEGDSKQQGEQIADRVDVLLNDQPLTLPNPYALLYLRRESRVDYAEGPSGTGGKVYRHIGGVYLIEVAA